VTLSENILFSNFELQVCNNKYYKIIVYNDTNFTITDLKKLIKVQTELVGHKLPVLILCSEFASTDIELLKTLSKNANNPYSKADAFVIKSMAQKILANFYIKINKPERPTKFFNNKEEAINWLKPFI
jgi:hypothetical protein